MDVIAEIGLTHEGSLGNALCMIDAAAQAGADGVKFQCHDGDPVDRFRPNTFVPQDKRRRDYWERTAFTLEEWRRIREKVEWWNRKKKLLFIMSVFSHEAACVAREVGVDAIKLGSGAALDESLRSACSDGWLILSTGLSTMSESIEIAMSSKAKRLSILQCTSLYPCPARMIGLQAACSMREQLPPSIEVGISDHSGQIWPSIAAADRGMVMVEVHVCYTRDQFGPDVPASIPFKQFKRLVRGVRFIEEMQKPFCKDEIASIAEATRRIFAPCEYVAS